MKRSISKSKKKKQSKLQRWLIKNSIIYRSARKFLKSKFGLVFISIIAFAFVLYLSFHLMNVSQVKRVLRGFEQALKQGNSENVFAYLNLGEDNPYRPTLPDISSLIEQKIFFEFRIKRLRFSQKYRWGEVEAEVETISDKERQDSFQGRILLNKKRKGFFSWEIAGVESY